MVKVAENRVVDLDVLPGKKEELQGQIDQATCVSLVLPYSTILSPMTSRTYANHSSFRGQIKGATTENLPEGARDRVEGVAGGAAGVTGGALNTAGGAVKGVVDTAGNTVGNSVFAVMLLRRLGGASTARDHSVLTYW